MMMESQNVTLKAKCYTVPNVFVCAGCGLLASSERSDALTCSQVCRVQAHRSGKLKQVRALAKRLEIPPSMIGQAQAINALCPHLSSRIKTAS
jgi:hypothetical protein